jgi:hypothetical protein
MVVNWVKVKAAGNLDSLFFLKTINPRRIFLPMH